MAKLAKSLEQGTSARFAIYADDVTIWYEGRDHSTTTDMLTELQAAVNTIKACLPQLGLELAAEKTELLMVSSTNKAQPTGDDLLYIGDTEIQMKRGHVRLLGLPLASCNSPKIWIAELRRKWKPMLKLIERLSNKHGGANQKACLTMARAVAIGTLAYGAPVYELNKTNTKHIQVLHRATLRTITGLPIHTKKAALEQAVAFPPIATVMKETKDQADRKRGLTCQGLLLTAWDEQKQSISDSIEMPLQQANPPGSSCNRIFFLSESFLS